MRYQGIDIQSLDPVQRMKIADVIYDSAVAEIEAASQKLTPEELAEIDQRIVGSVQNRLPHRSPGLI